MGEKGGGKSRDLKVRGEGDNKGLFPLLLIQCCLSSCVCVCAITSHIPCKFVRTQITVCKTKQVYAMATLMLTKS